MEIRDVNVKQVDERCPKCGKGWMRSTGVILTSNPPQYPHQCTVCSHKQTYGMTYPYIVTQ